jgi:hypothetical protein
VEGMLLSDIRKKGLHVLLAVTTKRLVAVEVKDKWVTKEDYK